MNLVLIGYRGSGKSVIARTLAPMLDMPVLSLDDDIVRRAGCPIPEIVRRQGWEAFRDIETEAVREASARDRTILDTGGGAILRVANRAALRRNGMVIWLHASVADIVDRIGCDTQRPSLTGAMSFTEEVESVLAERLPLYQEAADLAIDTSALPIPDAAAAVANAFRKGSTRPMPVSGLASANPSPYPHRHVDTPV